MDTSNNPGLFSNPIIDEKLRLIEASKFFSSVGGTNRAKRLSSERRSEIASKAANTRWKAPKAYA
jgi:hypothetical protein